MAATDPDNSDTLTYSLSGTDADSFNINTSTGQLQTKAAPDFEDKPEYYLTVWVRDSRGDDGTADMANDASIPVIISVTDVNERLRSHLRKSEDGTSTKTRYRAPTLVSLSKPSILRGIR